VAPADTMPRPRGGELGGRQRG